MAITGILLFGWCIRIAAKHLHKWLLCFWEVTATEDVAVCNGDNLFTNIVVRWPGSTHDAFIWNNCKCVRKIEEMNLQNTWILGDSAYPLKPYLLTPLPTANTEAERRFNVAHKRTRCVIERTFGIWKMKFRCLHKSGGYMTYTPIKCAKIITAVAVLHNMCISRNLPLIDDNVNHEDDDNDSDVNGDDNNENNRENNNNDDGRQVRDNLIREMFSHAS
ncbi:putative nuclease HARBI1 [Ruditapes philippinarum]|uniref:putative nuclease HARBI1 n=1 Tax=Ruditapes philippinarum TaxID=129788 RepID=UPI00295B9193|nr:putative nuclease HARBI1 [Ruditapes philippinarum]